MVLALVLALPVYFLVGLRLDNSGEHLFIAVGCLVLCSVSGTTMGLAAGSCSKDIVGALGLVSAHSHEGCCLELVLTGIIRCSQ